MWSFAVVESEESDCKNTARTRRFFDARPAMSVEWVQQRSPRAEELWKAAEGKFGRRKYSGFPLTVVLDSRGKVRWAGARLSNQQLLAPVLLVVVTAANDGETLAAVTDRIALAASRGIIGPVLPEE